MFIYLGFYIPFNTVQVISRRVVGMAEETSSYSWSRLCTVNCRPTASNYQLSYFRPSNFTRNNKAEKLYFHVRTLINANLWFYNQLKLTSLECFKNLHQAHQKEGGIMATKVKYLERRQKTLSLHNALLQLEALIFIIMSGELIFNMYEGFTKTQHFCVCIFFYKYHTNLSLSQYILFLCNLRRLR